MFGKTVTLFRLFGFAVRVDFTWLILAVLVTWSLATGLFPSQYEDLSRSAYWWMGVAGALGLFASIVFHELCHSLVARTYGLPMKGITLFIFGGVAEMSEEPKNPRAEFFMAAAGPLSSLLLAAVFHGLRLAAANVAWPPTIVGVLRYLAFINVLLACFNLLPAFPLDGGRILRSILWYVRNNFRWATRIASRIGAGFGTVLILLAVFSLVYGNVIGAVWWFLIGMFLRGAAKAAYQQIVVRRALEGEHVRRFMTPDPVTVSPDLSIEDLVEDYVYRRHYKMYPVVEDGLLVGCVTIDQIKAVPRDQWRARSVRDLAKECGPENTIGPESDAMQALATMNRTRASRLMVIDQGRLIGIIALKDMLEFLSLKIELEFGEDAQASAIPPPLAGRDSSTT